MAVWRNEKEEEKMTGEGVYVGRNCWTSPYTMNKGISITGNPGSEKLRV